MARPRTVRRRRVDATDEAKRRRQADLAALTRHPSWEVLGQEVDDRIAEIEKVVLAHVLGQGGGKPIDQNKLLWHRGFIAGMRSIARAPILAEMSLARYLESQGISMEGVDE